MMRSHPAEKVGRNDPCSCGSGKKFKRCCLASQQAPPAESPWYVQRKAAVRVSDEMLKFTKTRAESLIVMAWQDFNQEDVPALMDNYPGEEQIFFPYFFYTWDPDRPLLRRGQRPKPVIIARAFLTERARRLSDLERVILEQYIT